MALQEIKIGVFIFVFIGISQYVFTQCQQNKSKQDSFFYENIKRIETELTFESPTFPVDREQKDFINLMGLISGINPIVYNYTGNMSINKTIIENWKVWYDDNKDFITWDRIIKAKKYVEFEIYVPYLNHDSIERALIIGSPSR